MCSCFWTDSCTVFYRNIIDCIKHPDRGQVEDAVEKAMKEAEV